MLSSDLVKNSPFVLGTAQLGLQYGVANKTGLLSDDQAASVISTALQNGVVAFDTANSYGSSEARIGMSLSSDVRREDICVMTKLGPSAFDDKDNCMAIVEESIHKLNVPSLRIVYAHSVVSLGNKLSECFGAIKSAGLAQFVGISIYDLEDARRCLELDFVDGIQMPLNAFDIQAAKDSVDLAKSLNKFVMFRSVFLQGLLLLCPEQLPVRLSFAIPYLERWHLLCRRCQMSPAHVALKLAQYYACDNPLIIGCETSDQIRENLRVLSEPMDRILDFIDYVEALAGNIPEALRNPVLWPK